MKVRNIFGSFDRSPVGKTLIDLAESARPVSMEVERSHRVFETAIGYRRGVALVPKPDNLRLGLKRGHHLRFMLPESADRAIRLRVLKPNYNLPNGASVSMCAPEAKFLEGPQRRERRFDTRRIPNLLFGLPAHKATFRVLDLSAHGACVAAPSENGAPLFPLGESLAPAEIYVGNFRIPLVGVSTRSQRKQGLGLELIDNDDPRIRARMAKLLHVLERALSKLPLPEPAAG